MLILGIEGFYGEHHDNFYPSIWSQLQIDHKNELEEKHLMKLVWYCKFYDTRSYAALRAADLDCKIRF